MEQEAIAFFEFMRTAGIPYKTNRNEGSECYGVWLALAPALRKAGYRKPDDLDDPFDSIRTRKMIISGKLHTAIDMYEFAVMFAPFCCIQCVQNFGVSVVNGSALAQYQSGRTAIEREPTDALSVMESLEEKERLIAYGNAQSPGAGNLFSLPTTRMVGLGNGKTVFATADIDMSSEQAATASFLRVHPEWSNDVMECPDGDSRFTLPAALALSKFFQRIGYGDPEKVEAFQHALTERIIDSGGNFEPSGKRA